MIVFIALIPRRKLSTASRRFLYILFAYDWTIGPGVVISTASLPLPQMNAEDGLTWQKEF
jgi:hypothetical protein